VHRALSSLFTARGVTVQRTYQLNTGGNTDFMNMLDRQRLTSKKTSKTEAVQAALAERLEDENILIGPSEYVPWQKDNKLCFLRLEGAQWGDVPLNLELRLSVEDSPNAAACVMDAIRFCKTAMDRGESGVLTVPSAYYCKHPPQQLNEEVASRMLDAYLAEEAVAAE
jgi:myo-inositol-1-phosphate synthase